MLSKELTEMHERLTERDDEICELKAERNNTRVSHISMLYLCSSAGKFDSQCVVASKVWTCGT